MESGEANCQPNTLPSPSQVYDAYQTLLKDHKLISADKKAFAEKTFEMNKKRVAAGKKAITYTGRPSFVDQIKTSLKNSICWFFLSTIFSSSCRYCLRIK